MNDFQVTLEKLNFGYFWRIEKDDYEMTDWTFTKWGAKRQVNREIHRWYNKNSVIETYTVKGENK